MGNAREMAELRFQRSLESRIDADFSDVRIQRGPKAAVACDTIDALAGADATYDGAQLTGSEVRK